MARGKFNKRGGGKRVDAQSADEIEQRNERLAEFEENRTKRRAEEEEAQNGGGGEGEKEGGEEKSATETAKKGSPPKAGGDSDKGPEPPVVVTSAEDHRKNLRKLEMVRKRREVAEARRKVEEESELAEEMERKAHFKALTEEAEGDDGKKKKKKSKDKEIPKLTKIEIKKMKPSQMKDGEYDENIKNTLKRNIILAYMIDVFFISQPAPFLNYPSFLQH